MVRGGAIVSASKGNGVDNHTPTRSPAFFQTSANHEVTASSRPTSLKSPVLIYRPFHRIILAEKTSLPCGPRRVRLLNACRVEQNQTQVERWSLMNSPKAARISIRLFIAAGCVTALSSALPATALAATAHPSVVQPRSGDSCSVSITGQPQECTAIVGSGLHITSISGTFKNRSSTTYPNVQIVFYGPNGYITSTNYYPGTAGATLGPFVWHNPNPTANMTPGDYCTETEGPDGPNQADCVDVHS